jgi:hypothetical protein
MLYDKGTKVDLETVINVRKELHGENEMKIAKEKKSGSEVL